MASCSFKMPEDFLFRISTLADKTDEIIPRVLEEGGKVVKDKVKSNLESVSRILLFGHTFLILRLYLFFLQRFLSSQYWV